MKLRCTSLAAAACAGGALVLLLGSGSVLTRTNAAHSLASATTALPAPHCEIPCGIFDDHAEIQQMLLDAETIRKANAQISELGAKSPSAESLNTIARWAMVKEEHSKRIQHTVAWYFMTQRVKAVATGDAGHDLFVEKLVKFHAVSVAAMKASQSLDPSYSERLTSAINDVAVWYPG